MSNKHDLDAIRARSLDLAREYLGLEFKRAGASYKAVCPFHADHTPSFDYRESTRTFHCFSCSWSGGDVFALFMALRPGSTFREAVEVLGGRAPSQNASTPNVCFRSSQSSSAAHPENVPHAVAPAGAGEPDRCTRLEGRWRYTDATGRTLGFQDRVGDGAGGKRFRSWRWDPTPTPAARFARDPSWEPKAVGSPRPLYRLAELASRPEAPILVLEGERSADAAQTLFPTHVCITSMGGASAARSADWSPLRGRNVWLWPDNDAPGYHYVRDVTEILAAMNTALLVVRPDPRMSSGWDLADPLPEALVLDDLRRLLNEARCLGGVSR